MGLGSFIRFSKEYLILVIFLIAALLIIAHLRLEEGFGFGLAFVGSTTTGSLALGIWFALVVSSSSCSCRFLRHSLCTSYHKESNSLFL